MSTIFTDDFLIALSNWQKGWRENQDKRRVIADEVVLQCQNLPLKFKSVIEPCYRKRFINKGEVTPILTNQDGFFEGIASWSIDIDETKKFKGIHRPDTKFVMLFKHIPIPEEIVLNIMELWNDEEFVETAEKFKKENPDLAKPIFHFRDRQKEVILRSTLKANEIEDIVGASSSFEELCTIAEIPQENREELSKKFAKTGIPIEVSTFTGRNITKSSLLKTLEKFNDKLQSAESNRTLYDFSNASVPHKDDLKHKL
ncbi:hypothetical protein [Salegentibacter sp. Hel_I_6]|uniref:hypothetical protein n=1 Tax=Salegentibacter sp. Hel_I_6 TaxID=1250278 RepID=UPI00068AC3C9|nr:hypothetical protein [Salegentibacter sp. Hel_I_6]